MTGYGDLNISINFDYFSIYKQFKFHERSLLTSGPDVESEIEIIDVAKQEYQTCYILILSGSKSDQPIKLSKISCSLYISMALIHCS